MSVILHNPHSVLAALETRPEDFLELVVSGHSPEAAWKKVAELARQKKIQVSSSGRAPSQKSPTKADGRTSGSYAALKETDGVPAEELFADAKTRAGGKGLWLALDSLQDPHNVGAIFRAAAFFGVQGILLTEERSAPLSGTAYDVASGGLEYVPFTLQTNLQRAFEIAKDAGLWILGTSEHAGDELRSIPRDRPWLVVFGNEEKGMRRLTEESCDLLCRIAPRGKVTSLNVSVATGIVISTLTS